MEKWIVIPDVHGRDFWRYAVNGRDGEKIIFLGDYVDPYFWEGITPQEAFMGLQDIIELKKAYSDNVVLLLGNHDLGYLDSRICTCRRDQFRANRLREILQDNLNLFDIVHIEENGNGKALFSHAGIAESWVELHEDILGGLDGFRPERLNELLHGEPEDCQRLFRALEDASYFRGGDAEVGSPVWADVNEYLEGEKLLGGYIHIFGHSLNPEGPVKVENRGLCLDCARAFRLDSDILQGQ